MTAYGLKDFANKEKTMVFSSNYPIRTDIIGNIVIEQV